MAKSPKSTEGAEGDPKRGDQILKRMLQSKPKPHAKVVAERKGNQKSKRGKSDQ